MGTTLAQAYAGFLADAAHLDRLRPHTLRAYRYELALAAGEPRFAGDLAALSLADLEAWIARPPPAPSTVGRRAATFRRFFAWAVRHDFCARDPLAGYTGVRVRRHLPRPIREVDEQRRLDAAIAGAPQPYHRRRGELRRKVKLTVHIGSNDCQRPDPARHDAHVATLAAV